jgi:predicted lipid-binding transport protein (Tim44 family)
MASFDIILVAMVAAFIFLRLRSELGKKTGNEPTPPAANQAELDRLRRERDGYNNDPEPYEAEVIDLEEDPALRNAYGDIRRQDPSFEVGQFVGGAKSAYGMILEAFWGGDKQTLKDFLDDSVLSRFETAIDGREADGLKIENQLLDVTGVEVVAAELVGKMAQLTVHFTSEIVAVTRDKEGNVVEGDVSNAVEMNDNWTFARNVKSRDPRWTLVATSAG